MTRIEAAQLLQLPADADAAAVEARFRELRDTLEAKVVRAPTEGLKQKYRDGVDALVAARQVMLAGTDPSALPSPRRPAKPAPPSAPAGQPLRETPRAGASEGVASPRRSRAGAFALLAVALLAAALASWWHWRPALAPVEQLAAAKDAGNPVPEDAAARTEAQVDEYWRTVSPAELVAAAKGAWAEAEGVAEKYERESAERMRQYRDSPHRPAVWRAEMWVRARNLKLAADEIRKGLAPGAALARSLAELEAAAGAGDAASFDARREDFRELVSSLHSLHGIQWHTLVYLTDVEITTKPPGLEWSIETRFDGDKTLVVNGTTPVDTEMFVGTGEGVLRIKCPGKPDHVQKVTGIAQPYDMVFAEVSFQ